MTSEELEELDDLENKLIELAFEFWLEEKLNGKKNGV